MTKINEKIDKAYEQIEKEVDDIMTQKQKKVVAPKPINTKIKPRVYFQEKEKEETLTKAQTEKEIEEIKKELFI